MAESQTASCIKPAKQRKRGQLPNGPATRAQLEISQARTDRALDMFAAGEQTYEISKTIMAEFGCSYPRANVAMNRARKQFRQAARPKEIGERLGEAILRSEAHYKTCIAMGDAGAATKSLMWLGELQGVTAAQQQWEQEREAKHLLTMAQAAALFARAQREQQESETGNDASRKSDEELVAIVETAKVRINAGSNGTGGNGTSAD